MLPDDDGILVQVRDVGSAETFRILLYDHPTDVRVEETLLDGIGVFIGVSVAMVCAVVPRPPADGPLDGASANSGEVDLKGKGGPIRGMCPETLVA